MPRALALAPAALLALAGCGKLDQIDLTRSGSAIVPGAPGGAALPAGGIASFPISVGRDALAAQGIRPNDVDSAKLVGLRLEVTQGTSLERWLSSVSLYVEAPGFARVLVARKTGIDALPAGTTRVDLDTFGVDLKPYVLAPTTTVTAEGTGTVPPVDTTLLATATVRVDVNVTGLFR
ncbi:MAG TPA: hypothetical protein VF841_10095 [Anaeromyxobacter sp.]